VKGGRTIGATDDFGFRSVENRVHVNDLHATILRLLGWTTPKLTFLFQVGINELDRCGWGE